MKQDIGSPTEPQGDFVSASPRNPAEPVGRFGNDWGFWDETWTLWYGGHADETAARTALEEYCKRL